MPDVDKAVATQISNIENKTGKSLAQLRAAIAGCGKAKHGEIRGWLMTTYGLGHGDANTLTHVKGEVKDPRVRALPPGGMCQYVVPLTSADQVDARLIAIVRTAFDGAA
jgi:hypothetical protein